MSQDDSGVAAPTTEGSGDGSGRGVAFALKLVAIAGILLILILLIIGLALALTAAETWAPFVQIMRDIFIVILVLESLLIATALAILMLQAVSFIIMLKSEIKPILDNARETTRMTKATAEFVSKNSADPIIQIKSFLAGLLTFLREIIRIRDLVGSAPKEEIKIDGD